MARHARSRFAPVGIAPAARAAARPRRALRRATLAAGALGASALAASLLVAVAPSARAQAGGPPAATIAPSFSPLVPGALTAVTFAASFAPPASEAGALPPPLRHAVLWFPAGLAAPSSLSWPRTRGCSAAHLRKHGARGCPRSSRIGSGSAVVGWSEGPAIHTERVKLQIFIGPTNGEYAFKVLAEGTHPYRRRAVINESLFAASAPYSAGMEIAFPDIVSRPGQPPAVLLSYTATIARAHGRAGLGERVPRTCPAGGYVWAADFTFANGVAEHVPATSPCA